MKTSIIIKLILAICLYLAIGFNLCQSKSSIDDSLSRVADLGFRTNIENQRIVVNKVTPDSPAAQAGLLVGDIIESFADQFTHSQMPQSLLTAQSDLYKWRGEKPIALKVLRNDKAISLRFTPLKKPLEAIEGINSYYSSVKTTQGHQLRTIVSVPDDNKAGPRPALFFVQWVSCGSIEYNPKSPSRQQLIELQQQTNRALIRVERSSDGDSLGPACHQLDYNTELDHYFQAYLKLRNHPQIDPNKIVIYGSSLGSTMAPLLAEKLIAKGIDLEGLMIQGGGGLTHTERMLAFERIYLERRPEINPETIHQQMNDRIQFQVEYLIKSRHPDAIAKDSAAMAKIRNDILGMDQLTHYGRPYSWHQQAAKQNLLKAWHQIAKPVLVVFNEYDQFETRHGHQIISQMVNRWRPNTAQYVEQAKTGHGNYQYENIESAYQFKGGTNATTQLVKIMADWTNSLK